jgi:1-deoxy-D-xylulose-5-phosphate synthase
MVLMAAIDEPTLRAALEFMRLHDTGPCAVRYPREEVPAPAERDPAPFELGRAHRLADGDDLAILAYGFPVHAALAARERLQGEGYRVAVYDARFAKPVDVDLLRELTRGDVPLLTVEDHHILGGFGSCVADACVEHGLPTVNLHRLGLPDAWIHQGSRGEQQAQAGIDVEGILRTATAVLERRAGKTTRRRVAASRGLSAMS